MYILGLGYCTLTVITIVTIYYMVIISWIIFYFVVSINFTSDLGWGSCNHDFNTDSKCDLNIYFFVHISIFLTPSWAFARFIASDIFERARIYERNNPVSVCYTAYRTHSHLQRMYVHLYDVHKHTSHFNMIINIFFSFGHSFVRPFRPFYMSNHFIILSECNTVASTTRSLTIYLQKPSS